jgi:hypothetical protein
MRRGRTLKTFNLILCSSVFLCVDSLRAQNIVGHTAAQFTANPVRLTDTDVSEFFLRPPQVATRAESSEAKRIAAKLEAHVAAFLEGAPWMPFQHTLGISGYETSFSHPDEMFLSLALALSHLKPETAAKAREFLKRELSSSPPYAEAGFNYRTGRARESYEVPTNLRRSGQGTAFSALGIYSFWAYCHSAGDSDAANAHWERIKTRARPLLEGDYPFDTRRTNSTKGEAQKLNGDLAGLVGLVRLARLNQDVEAERAARHRGRDLFELRVNLERVNPVFVEKSSAATKSLHNFRLSRYCDLVPEVAEAVARLTDRCGSRNLQTFREERNGWYLAFGDRLIGGENYTNPIHFSHSLFIGAALIERLPATQLAGYVDVPWCKGDFYFMEKCTYTLWAFGGRPWISL